MARSKYPTALDTSKEIPAVRDNILEIGSDAMNSLRSAVFNIEKTLGINPQGASGNTVANRLNSALDGNGKIKKEALSLANVLSGPITDVDVSSVAAISEKKLRLNFPTQVLQDEISILNRELDSIESQIKDISASLSAHLNSSAINRHAGAAISVAPVTSEGSDEGLIDIEADDVQEALKDIHDRHINYTGEDISSTNNSHLAAQIYFDDDDVSDLIVADDVQEAIEKTVALTSKETVLHQDRLHSNGYLRNGFLKDATDETVGLIFAADVGVSFSNSSGESDYLTKISFDDPIDIEEFAPKKGDWIVITDPADTEKLYTGTFEIAIINLTSDEESLASVEIFGFLHGTETATTTVTVAKSPRRAQSVPGLILGIREKATLTSATSLQVANPDAAALVSKNVRPSEITSTNRFVVLSIDGSSSLKLDMYDSASTVQTVDSIVKRINEQAVEGNKNFLAYRIDIEKGGVEFAIVHNLPDTTLDQRILKVSGSTDDGITAAGLAHLRDLDVSAEVGSLYFINGESHSGLKEKLNTEELTYFSGATTVTVGSSSLNFLELDIKAGDLLVILDGEDGSDDGSFVISDVSEFSISLDSDQLPAGFIGGDGDSTSFCIYESIFSLDSVVFDSVSSSLGGMLIECFIDTNQRLFWNKKLEYEATISGVDALFAVVDYEGRFSDDDVLTVKAESIDSVLHMSLDSGQTQRVSGENSYIWLTSSLDNRSLKVHVPDAASLLSNITANGTISTSVFAFDSVNDENSIILGRVPFANYRGRIIGGVDADNPRVFRPVYKGTVGYDDLRTDAIKGVAEIPVNDLRSNGVVSGLKVTSATITDGLYVVAIDAGICYVRGKRMHVGSSTFTTHITSSTIDKFYIAVNEEGEVVFEAAEAITCDNPFADTDLVELATVEYDSTTVRLIDIRLFISDIDLKLLNAISVSPDPRMGHFSTISDGLRYAKRFSDMFPKAGRPTVHLKSGTHTVTATQDQSSEDFSSWIVDHITDPTTGFGEMYTSMFNAGLVVDFPVHITGEGDNTIVKLRNSITFSDQVVSLRGEFIIPGDKSTGISGPNDTFTSGFIKFSDFRMDNSRITFADFNVVDSSGSAFVCGVDINSVIFDGQNFDGTNTFDTLIGARAISLQEIDDTSTNKGNVRIKNCIFIDMSVFVDEKTRTQNFHFIDNISYGSSTNSLIRGDILTFVSAVDGSNIEIRGNMIADNHDANEGSSPPTLISGSTRMGSRTESDYYIGGFVEANDYIKADDYQYNASKDALRYTHAGEMTDVAMYETSPGMSFTTFANGTRTVRTINSPVSTSDFCIVRLPEVRDGQTITGILVYFYVETPVSIYSAYDYELYSENQSLTRTLESSGGTTSSILTSNFGLSSISSLSISGDNNKHFFVKLSRTAASGTIQHITHVAYSVSTTTVEGIGGF